MNSDEPGKSTRTFTVVARSASGCTFAPDGYFLARNCPSWTGPVTIVFRTRRVNAKGFSKPIPRGLWAEITGSAPDLKSAINSFGQAAQNLVPVLVIATNAPIGDLTPEIAFETTKDIEEREFFQQFLLDERLLPFERRPVPCRLARAILKALGHSPDYKRIHRALAHYYHALNNWGFGTEILALAHIFMAMEALTPVVLRRLLAAKGVSSDNLIAQWSIEPSRLQSEVRRRILFNGDTELYRAVKRASDGFEHGFLPFPDIHETAIRNREAAARCLREAILRSLDLGEDVMMELTAPLYDQPFSLRFAKYVWGKLLGSRDDLAAPDQQYPILKWRSDAVEEPSPETDDPKIGFRETLTPTLGEDISFQVLRYEVWGSKGKTASAG
jgi:hypothetical protein